MGNPGMKITTPPLIKMRSVVSDDGRSVRFFLLFQTGQNSAFSLPFNKIGLFYNAIKNVVGQMGQRVAVRGGSDAAEISEGLAYRQGGRERPRCRYRRQTLVDRDE